VKSLETRSRARSICSASRFTDIVLKINKSVNLFVDFKHLVLSIYLQFVMNKAESLSALYNRVMALRVQ
jgi:hypothetical protein